MERHTSVPADYHVRTAGMADAAVIAHHRAAMFRDMGMLADGDVEALRAASQTYLARALSGGDYLGWLVECERRVVAGGGALLRPLLPRPGYPHGGEEVYVLNVYTEAEHRRRGLARHLMQVILAWCESRNVTRITLHASDEGRPLYKHLGFEPTNEMRLDAKP